MLFNKYLGLSDLIIFLKIALKDKFKNDEGYSSLRNRKLNSNLKNFLSCPLLLSKVRWYLLIPNFRYASW